MRKPATKRRLDFWMATAFGLAMTISHRKRSAAIQHPLIR
jgi:hypothetical protein